MVAKRALETVKFAKAAKSLATIANGLNQFYYPDYYNKRRIKAKLRDLPPAMYRQQANSVA